MQFNQAKFNQVIDSAKAKATGNVRWMRAIEKAAAGLMGAWIVTELMSGLLITTESGETYHVNGHCICKAAQSGDVICKHRAAKRLITLYNEMETAPAPAPLSREEIEREIEQRWAARYPTFPLWMTLRKFYGANCLALLSDVRLAEFASKF